MGIELSCSNHISCALIGSSFYTAVQPVYATSINLEYGCLQTHTANAVHYTGCALSALVYTSATKLNEHEITLSKLVTPKRISHVQVSEHPTAATQNKWRSTWQQRSPHTREGSPVVDKRMFAVLKTKQSLSPQLKKY